MATEAQTPNEALVVKHCGLILPGDSLLCPCCGLWLHEAPED